MILLVAQALAAPPEVPDDGEDIDIGNDAGKTGSSSDWGFQSGDGSKIDTLDDDEGMVDFVAQQKRQPPPPTHFHLDGAVGKALANDYEPYLVSTSDRYFVVEIPVLAATSREAFAAAHPGGLEIAGTWILGGQVVATRQVVEPAGVLASGPTWVFLKAALPSTAATAEAQVIVSAGDVRYERKLPVSRR